MVGGDALSGRDLEIAQSEWKGAAWSAIHWTDHLERLNVHKSVSARILEPYLWQTTIVTAVDRDGASYENFFNLRCSPNAQPERIASAAVTRAIERISEAP